MKFNSRFSPGKKVTGAQLITELICEKKAAIDGIELPDQFWSSNKAWATFFKEQSVPANRLVKEYGVVPVLKALQDKKTYNVYSLMHPIIKELSIHFKNTLPTVVAAEEITKITKESIGIFSKSKTNLDLLD